MSEKVIEIHYASGEKLRGILTYNGSHKLPKLVVSITGFEQPGTAEEKFKTFGKAVLENGIASFRFRFFRTWCLRREV